MAILYVGIGFVLLLAGRLAYPLFVGGAGFLVGTFLTEELSIVPTEWNVLMLPLLLGVLGALAGFAFRRWAVRVGGFFAGGYVVFYLPVVFGASERWDSWLLFILAGGICVLLLFLVFDFALILISTVLGVTLILQSMSFGRLDNTTMFIILTMFGIIVQYLLLQFGKPSPD